MKCRYCYEDAIDSYPINGVASPQLLCKQHAFEHGWYVVDLPDGKQDAGEMSREELEKLLSERPSTKEFRRELLGEWVKAKDLEKFEEEMEYEYAKGMMMPPAREARDLEDLVKNGGSLDLPVEPAISGEIRFPIKNRKIKPFVEELPDGHVSPPIDDDAFREFVVPIIKQGFPKTKIEDLISKQPLGTPDMHGASGIFDLKTMNQPNTACPLPEGTCETCLGNCVRPGSGDTCGACNGTGMTDEAYKEFLARTSQGMQQAGEAAKVLGETATQTAEAARELADAIPDNVLSTEEQALADTLENAIEDCLEALYDPAKPKETIRVDMLEEVPFNVLKYLVGRFTGWDIDCDSNALEFTPK